uniref:Putative secreted protein n=1 Tax=Anopheles triannulatus TaxID=58253 RepID=A0A2M4B0X9_9DIPT
MLPFVIPFRALVRLLTINECTNTISVTSISSMATTTAIATLRQSITNAWKLSKSTRNRSFTSRSAASLSRIRRFCSSISCNVFAYECCSSSTCFRYRRLSSSRYWPDRLMFRSRAFIRFESRRKTLSGCPFDGPVGGGVTKEVVVVYDPSAALLPPPSDGPVPPPAISIDPPSSIWESH